MGKMQKDNNKKPTHDLYGGLGKTSILNILVPRDMVSVIIGQGGSTIEMKLQNKHNPRSILVKLILEEIITIKGNLENCTNACRKILEILQQKASIADKSDMTLRILIHENLISLIFGEEGNTIRNTMSDTETKINVSGISDITIANINYNGVCTVEGSIENISKAEAQISAKLRQEMFCIKGQRPLLLLKMKRNLCNTYLCPAIKLMVHIDKNYSVGPTEKAIKIKGKPENCTNACRKILEILQQNATNPSISNVIINNLHHKRICTVKGSIENISKAEAQISAMLRQRYRDVLYETSETIPAIENETEFKLRILVPSDKTHVIIGKNGVIIKKITQETKTRITDITMDSFNYERIFTIKGSIENICKAQAQISEKISQGFGKMSLYKLIRVKPEMTNKKYTLLIVGLSYVGKSSIIKRYCQEVYQNTYQLTLGMDIHPIFIRFKNETIHLENRDMAGTEKHCTLENSYRGVHDGWIKHIETFADTNTVKILIGSKCDDTSNRMISIKEGQILDSINVIHKPMLDSDIKPSTILEQCPIIKKKLVKLPEVPNIQSQDDDQEPKEHNQLIKINSELIDESYKLIIVGPSNVGKSSIIKKFFKGVYSDNGVNDTIGIDFQQTVVKFKNKFIEIKIW
ncbi:hypothetical protein AGLY_016278 [Aphis glycines]|uniref:K Homology domain-containing protein n=1 Tax=Aphis glycines TaxID=307491 RepID=A0A6G0SY52_APHGL|nr:hypothetical protein AGLY_016278 [Aphis glycines]